jgi:hypothetical protein
VPRYLFFGPPFRFLPERADGYNILTLESGIDVVDEE